MIKKTQDFFNQYPTLSFRIYEGTTYEMIDLLLSHNIDLGIVRTPFDQSQVNAYSLEPEPMVAVGTKEYLTPDMTSIENYKDIPLIIHQRYLPLISDYCLNLRFNPLVKMISDDCRTSLIWASSGLGVAIVPTSALLLIQNTSLIQVPLQDEGLLTSVTFITRKDEAILLKVKQFIQSFCQKML